MHVVIVGAGVVGAQLAHQLALQKHDVTIIEKDAQVARQISRRLDCLVIQQVGNNPEILKQSGAEKADFLVCLTHSDELNLLICNMVSVRSGRPVKIARVRNVSYSSLSGYKQFFNSNYLINPEIEAARAIVRSIAAGALSDILVFDGSSIEIRNLRINKPSKLCNRPLRSVVQETDYAFLVVLIVRGDQHLIPSGESSIQEGDTIYIAAEKEQFRSLYRFFGYTPRYARKILLIGGGKVGALIAAHFIGRNRSLLGNVYPISHIKNPKLKVVEKDQQKARQMAADFPNALVLNADITDSDLFEEEKLDTSELLITATENEELNLLSAAYGKTRGIDRAIVLVSKSTYTDFANKLGIDVAVSVKYTVVNAIMQIIRREHVSSLYSISDGKIEVLELNVASKSRANGRQIKEMVLPPHSLLISVSRKNKTFLPQGELTIRENDRIIIIAANESTQKIQKLFIGNTT